MLMVLFLHLLVSAIILFRDRFCLRRLLRCYICLLSNECAPIGSSVDIFFVLSKSFCCSVSHFHSVFSLGKFRDLFVFSDSRGRNFAKYCIAPRKDFSCFRFSGCFKSSMVLTFPLFGFIPSSPISCPSYFILF